MNRPPRLRPLTEGFVRYDNRASPLLVPVTLAGRLRQERAALDEDDGPFDMPSPAVREPDREVAPPGFPVAPPGRRRGGVRVFDAEAVARALKATSQSRREEKERMLQVLGEAARDEGYRQVLRPRRAALRKLEVALLQAFPNFGAVVTRLIPELALQGVRTKAAFRMTPMLLYGAPGVGKTTFASTLAQRLGVDWDVISAGGAQGAFEIVGTSRNWSTTSPGRVAQLLARSRFASAILVIDEVDKISGDQQQPVLPALLDLLEERSARRFRDTSLDLTCDASRLIVLATANDIERVPAPLRSRLQEIEVAMPTAAERRVIAEGMAQALLQPVRTADRPTLDPAVLDRLAAAPIDLREVQRRLAQTVGQAVLARRKRLSVADLPRGVEALARPRMGFV